MTGEQPTRRFAVRFDELRWARDIARTPAGRGAAETWRADCETHGLDRSVLRPCSRDAADGTDLPGCVKTYIPAPIGDWGAVLVASLQQPDGGVALDVLAFGLRHPPTGRRDSVYRLAHRRLHGDTT